MRLGTTLPQFGNALDEADRIGEFAEMAEDVGVDSLWVGDRLLAAVDPTTASTPSGPARPPR